MLVHDVATVGTDLRRSDRVLLVAQTQRSSDALLRLLTSAGCFVSIVERDAMSAELVASRHPDVGVIEEGGAGCHVWTELRQLRNRGFSPPVLLVGSSTTSAQRARALPAEVDDFILLPMAEADFARRIVGLVRHWAATPSAGTEHFAFGEVTVDIAAGIVRRRGLPVRVAPKEFDVLVTLYRAHGRLVSRAELLRHVWNYTHDVHTRTVDTAMCALRRKLEADPSQPRHLITVPRRGYRLDAWTHAEHTLAIELNARAS